MGQLKDRGDATAQQHYRGHRKRLRERFVKGGLAGFAAHEVIELLLTLAIPRTDVKQPAKALLTRFGSLRATLDAPLSELRAVDGVGEVAATALHVIREAANLYLQEASEGTEVLKDSAQLERFWRMRIGALKHEVFAVAYLDSAHRLLHDGVETLQTGTVDRAAVYPRRVIDAALKRQAAAQYWRTTIRTATCSQAITTRFLHAPLSLPPRRSAYGWWIT